MQVGERAGEVVDRGEDEMLCGAGRRLDRGRAQWRRTTRRIDDAVHAACLCAAQQRAEVLRILERIEHEHERCLVALAGAGEDRVDVTGRPRPRDECDALVAVEARERRQRAALDLDNRDAQRRGMDRERVEGRAPLRHDQQSERIAARGERLLDGPAARDELLPFAEQCVSIDDVARAADARRTRAARCTDDCASNGGRRGRSPYGRSVRRSSRRA